MSRSTRKTPIFGITTSASEKADKRIWHRRMRARSRTKLASTPTEGLDSFLPTHLYEVSQVWEMAKDGRRYAAPVEVARWAVASGDRRGRTAREAESLGMRRLHQIIGK